MTRRSEVADVDVWLYALAACSQSISGSSQLLYLWCELEFNELNIVLSFGQFIGAKTRSLSHSFYQAIVSAHPDYIGFLDLIVARRTEARIALLKTSFLLGSGARL